MDEASHGRVRCRGEEAVGPTSAAKAKVLNQVGPGSDAQGVLTFNVGNLRARSNVVSGYGAGNFISSSMRSTRWCA